MKMKLTNSVYNQPSCRFLLVTLLPGFWKRVTYSSGKLLTAIK